MKTGLFYLVIASCCLLLGCFEKSMDSSDVDNELLENEQLIDVVTSNDQAENKKITQKEPSIYPTVVTILDPRSLEIVHSITPQFLGFDTDLELYKSKIQDMAKKLARGTEKSPGYDRSMVLDKIGENGEIIQGEAGLILKESELVEQVLAASTTGEHVYLPLYLMESNYNIEEVSSLNEATVASFTTYFQSSEIGRSKNIELSAEALNNIIVGDGDYFSFNTMVGERTEAKGYQAAPEIINKKKVMGIGGGICQTSSTLFNAVDQLGVRMTEWHHHSLNVGYVPTGRDATVSYGLLDFKFQNNRGAPFLIKAFYTKNVLTIEIRTAEKYRELMEK